MAVTMVIIIMAIISWSSAGQEMAVVIMMVISETDRHELLMRAAPRARARAAGQE